MESAAHIRLVFRKAHKAIKKADLASIADTGLTISDFTIMEVLLHRGSLPINAIGEKVFLTSGSMTAAINRLDEKGFVTRIQDPADGRCFHVHLTKNGRHIIEQAYAKHESNLERIAAVLTDEERHDLVRLLKKIGFQAEAVLPT